MGSICSCLCLEDLEGYIHSDASIHRPCSCYRSLAQQLIYVYTAFFPREEVQAAPLVEQGMDSSTSITDNSISDTFHSTPRPLPYDDPRYSRAQHYAVISRHDKLSHLHEESEALRGSKNVSIMEMTTTKCSGSNYDAASKLFCSNPNSLIEVRNGMTYILPSYKNEDEDVCPTCLEEYTYENPRIITKCSHHFHLGCIYEWKERSDLCPVCSKVMVFDET